MDDNEYKNISRCKFNVPFLICKQECSTSCMAIRFFNYISNIIVNNSQKKNINTFYFFRRVRFKFEK